MKNVPKISFFIFLFQKKIFFDFLFRHRIDLVESCSKTYLFTPFCKTHPLKNGKSPKNPPNPQNTRKTPAKIPKRVSFWRNFRGPLYIFSITSRVRFVVVKTLKYNFRKIFDPKPARSESMCVQNDMCQESALENYVRCGDLK